MFRNITIGLLTTIILGMAGPGWAEEPAPGTLSQDVEFARVGDVSLTLDAFVPAGKGPFPTCIIVHGGGYTKGDKTSYVKPLFAPLSQAGFAWFSINYRLAPAHRWPACVEDVRAAIAWVKAHADQYHVDVNRIALIGESAGAHLAAFAVVGGPKESQVAAVVPFYGAFDRELQTRHFNRLGASTIALFGVTELNDETWRLLRESSVNPLLHSGLPPFLLIHGDQDQQVPLKQSIQFQKQMKELGNDCELIVIPGGGHGMGSWRKLDSDYLARMIAWLQNRLKIEK